jgi:hypothetical protein
MLGRRKPESSDGDLNAMIALVMGVPARHALQFAGYSKKTRERRTAHVLHGAPLQAAARRLGLALVTDAMPEYKRILQDEYETPRIILETVQDIYDDWVKDGKPETPGLAQLPEVARVTLETGLRLKSDGELSELAKIRDEDQIPPGTLSNVAQHVILKKLLNPKTDARCLTTFCRLALEIDQVIGNSDGMALHLHQHERVDAAQCKLIAQAVHEVWQEAGAEKVIDVEKVQ